MRAVLINLEHAEKRRRKMTDEFARVGIDCEVWPAVDARLLTEGDRHFVDADARRRLGLHPVPDGSLANTLSQRAAMRHLVETGPEMMAVFEDDSRLDPALPAVLSALETYSDLFDVVVLQRRNFRKRFIGCTTLETGHMLGRVRFADYGSNGYVITRSAAERFLARTPRMVWEIDHALSRFWDNGLDVFYVDPPVVSHDRTLSSQIEEGRQAKRAEHRAIQRRPGAIARRLVRVVNHDIRRRIAFRKQIRADRERFAVCHG